MYLAESLPVCVTSGDHAFRLSFKERHSVETSRRDRVVVRIVLIERKIVPIHVDPLGGDTVVKGAQVSRAGLLSDFPLIV